jgi:putative glycosyltransferase
MKISVVTTLYCSASYVKEFHWRISTVLRGLVNIDYEIIMVNDGSPDDSLSIAVEIAEADTHVIVVDLSRNFGHHKAMMTGLDYASGDLVFLIDSDLEEDPELLNQFFPLMEKLKCDVVYGVQEKRKGKWFERWSGKWFYFLFNLLSGLEIPENVVTARLMTKRYVKALLLHKEREVFMAGLWHITGFEQVPSIVKKHSTSASTYTLSKKIALLINSLTSFSNLPLVSIFYIGLSISLLAMTYIGYLIIYWFFFAKPLSGWTSLMASIWLLGGMVISFIGVVGIYLSKIFSETKQRPYTIVKQVYKNERK